MNVKIYTTPTCPFCRRTKDFFNRNNIKYKEIDVSNDEKAAQEMIKKSGIMAVPVIEINGDIIIGYDEEKLKKVLKIK